MKNNNMWESYPHIWKTQSIFFSWIRGGVRRSLWNRHPIKLEFLKNNRKRIVNPNPKGKISHVWGGECSLCNRDFPLKDIEVDHKKGNHSLNKIEDIQKFIEGIVLVTENDLQLICKPCHKAKSMSEKQGISFEEANVSRKIIEIVKNKQDRQWLIDRNIVPESNQTKRKEQIRKALEEDL